MIPSYTAFVAAVSKNNGGLGSNLVKVTDALYDYWDAVGKGNQSLEEEVALLKDMYNECSKWIKKKEGKSEFKKNLFGKDTNYYNQLFVTRKREISNLARESLSAMMDLLKRSGTLTPDLRGQLQFDIRKFHQKGQLRTSQFQTKGLSKGYELERQSWLKSGKTLALSGSALHETMGYTDLKRPQLKALEKIKSGKETVDQWRILLDVENGVKGEGTVIYLKKKQRYQFMLFIEDGIFKDYNGDPADYGTGRWSQRLYAMDRYGNMFTYGDLDLGTDIGRNDLGKAKVNHSSMNSGKEVICAGMMNVNHGKLTSLTNSSGHYKPSKVDLCRCLTILQSDGLDLSETEVVAIGGPGTTPDTVMWEHFTPAHFLNTGGLGQPDIKRQEGPKP